MIRKYVFGDPIETDAVVREIGESCWSDGLLHKEGNAFYYELQPDEIVYGLGENVRGMNKRGWRYVSNCSDNPNHCEHTNSLYGAHNFIMAGDGTDNTFGVFVDIPGKITFDVGYTNTDQLVILPEDENYKLYLIEGNSYQEVVREFRELIGRSYIAPRWALGYGQSRWSYFTADEVREVVKEHRSRGIPLDSVYLDIDYMERYKDFTINRETFADFESLVQEMKEQNIHLVPIIDAGVKKEDGYDVYEEGKENGYFCKDENGKDFIVGVWPGRCCFPDMLNDKAREWFGNKYRILIDKGIDGFWNDMNEPAIFYSEKRLKKVFEKLDECKAMNLDVNSFFEMTELVSTIANNPEDYASFYHNYKGKRYRHDRVHNLFGYYMTRSASEAFQRYLPEKRILLFSRASYIGMHRYGGIWQGDNLSWWSHLKMNVQMMPSLNMCGYLYTGADTGGFGADVTEDLLLRWMEFAVFTPLFRNHSARGTRQQEAYRFSHEDRFVNVIGARYQLLPYLYSEYMKAALSGTMMFSPLSFAYGKDALARQVEDQLLVGENIMVAPVYTQNVTGRVVYFPERMKELVFEEGKLTEGKIFEKGFSYVEMPIGTVHVFLREGYLLPVSKGGKCV
ncbi:MAG: glycoside hydrolase family 31 protein, partial [Bacillota bacterium]|nr:glycoside hydrolase family 31 protein [Bacillota bacterium]